MLETVLIRTFMLLYVSDCEGDDDRPVYNPGMSRSSERRAYTTLASVCYYWRQTLTGWPQSPTSQWVRHQLKKLIQCKYAWKLLPCLQSSSVRGLTALWAVLLHCSLYSLLSFLLFILSMLWYPTVTLLVFIYDVVQVKFPTWFPSPHSQISLSCACNM